MRQLRWIVLWSVLAGPAWGQDAARLRFFDCGTVRFFGEACVPESQTTVGRPPAVASMPPAAVAVTRPEPLPAAATVPASASAPLFPPDTMAPGTPPLLLQLLQEPTTARAQAFLDWQQARLARILEVQRLLQRLGQTQGGTGRATGEQPDSLTSTLGMSQVSEQSADEASCPLIPGADGRRVCALRQP